MKNRFSEGHNRSVRRGSALVVQTRRLGRSGGRRRRGVVLLFVVVLLTLLAIVASAFLISTRLASGQSGVDARGGQVFQDGVDAEGQIVAVRDRAIESVQLQIALDVFETVRDNPAGNTTAARTINFANDLAWRPTRATANTGFYGNNNVPPNPVRPQDLNVFAPMQTYVAVAYPGTTFRVRETLSTPRRRSMGERLVTPTATRPTPRRRRRCGFRIFRSTHLATPTRTWPRRVQRRRPASSLTVPRSRCPAA